MRHTTLLTIMTLSLLSLTACSLMPKGEAKYPERQAGDRDIVYAGEREGLFGKGGMGLFNSKKDEQNQAGITVNAYLWRAALDSISFMPIANADPFGGTILTDWYEAPEAKGERLKANIMILSRSLRTDALKVSLFRQVRGGNGQWQDAAVDPKTVSHLEEAILTRARQLRVAATEEAE
jgi:hypothetical protein